MGAKPDWNVKVPTWVIDLNSFIRWAASPDFPEKVRVSYLVGEVWIDASAEPLFTHNQVVLKISSTLQKLAYTVAPGYIFYAGAMFRSVAADLATQPDATFVSYASLERGSVELVGISSDEPELIDCTPDVVLEVVSDTTVERDTTVHRELYWKAGIPEYWLVDARTESVQFDILKRGPKGFLDSRKSAGGWLKSRVFGRHFRITCSVDDRGFPQFQLESKK